MEKSIKCTSKAQAKLSIFRIILISLLCAIVILLHIIGYFIEEYSGEKPELLIYHNKLTAIHTRTDIAIFTICEPIVLAIIILIAFRPYKKVAANILINPNSITIDFFNIKNSKFEKKYILDVSKIKTIAYSFLRESNENILTFKGNKNMITNKKLSDNHRFELIFNENLDEICNSITEITNLKIKGL